MGENENVALKQIQKEAQESSQNLIPKKFKEIYDREYSNNSSLTSKHHHIIFWLFVIIPALLAHPYQTLLDPIDVCIIGCDSCYKGEVVVKCANECIITNGNVGLKWRENCPRLHLPIYEINFEELNNK